MTDIKRCPECGGVNWAGELEVDFVTGAEREFLVCMECGYEIGDEE